MKGTSETALLSLLVKFRNPRDQLDPWRGGNHSPAFRTLRVVPLDLVQIQYHTLHAVDGALVQALAQRISTCR